MLKINETTRIYLGVQGENLQMTISIDVNTWLKEFPNGSISIWHKRNGDSSPSATGATLDREKGILSWSPTSTDTYVAGEGEAEVRLTEGNVKKKTKAIITGVSPSVTGAGGLTGSGWQDYINIVESYKNAASEAQTAAETAQGLAEDAQDAAEDAQEAAETAQDKAEIAAGIAIAQAGQLKFEVNNEGHLIMSYTDEVPIAEEE